MHNLTLLVPRHQLSTSHSQTHIKHVTIHTHLHLLIIFSVFLVPSDRSQMRTLHEIHGQPPTTSPTRPAGSDLAESMVISFGSVISIVIFYILLNLACRIVRRRRLEHHVNDNHSPTVKLDDECVKQVEAIPMVLYVKPPRGSEGDDDISLEPEICSVCLGEYEEGEEVRVLSNCGHVFHRECIDRWLLGRSSFCPICRDRVVHRSNEILQGDCGRNGEDNRSETLEGTSLPPQQQQQEVAMVVGAAHLGMRPPTMM